MGTIVLGDSNSLFIELDGYENLAVPGYRTEDVLRDLIDLEGGETIIIGVGINDSAFIKDLNSGDTISSDIDEFRNGYSSLLKLAKTMFKGVVVIGLISSTEKPVILGNAEIRYSNETITEFNECMKDLCIRMGVKFVDLLPYFMGKEGELLADHIHPNEKGRKIIVAKLVNLI